MKRFYYLFKKLIQKIVRRITIGKDKPKILKEAGFSFFWDDVKVQAIDEPVSEMSINELLWNLDLPHWEEELIDDWNLTPKEVIEHPKYHQNHYNRIQKVNLKYPICITKNKKDKWFVLDGTHRLAKAFLEKHKTVKVKIIPGNRISKIKKN